MSHKTAETTCNINSTFGPGTVNEYTGQWWLKTFCKENKNPWKYHPQCGYFFEGPPNIPLHLT